MGFFVLWAGAGVGLLLGLARAGCAVGSDAAVAAAPVPAGWRMEHWLASDHGLTPRLADRLIRQGPRRGIRESVRVDGRDEQLVARLTRQGWQVLTGDVGPDFPAEPEVRVFSPSGTLEWRGGFRAAEVTTDGAVILDDLAFAQVAQGRRLPSTVPIGCASPAAEATARVRPFMAIFNPAL